MDRSNRTVILEPIMLIMKQRTGMATIISIILSLALDYLGVEKEIILLVVSSVMMYVGKQTYLDAKEVSPTIVEIVGEIEEIIGTEHGEDRTDTGKV